MRLAETVALTAEFEDMATVREPIQQCAKESCILKNLCPLGERQIGCDQERTLLVSLADKSKQHLGALLRKGDKAQLVNDDESMFEQAFF